MSATSANPGFVTLKLGDVAKSFSVHAALIDRFGVIVAVNEQWKEFAETRGLALPQYGIGENYLRHCAFADPLSPRLIRGMSQLLAGEINRLSVVYPCGDGSGDRKTWFLLLAFSHPEDPDHLVVMHIDITMLISIFSLYPRDAATDDPFSDHSASSAGAGAPSANAIEQTLMTMVPDLGERGPQGRRQQSQRGEGKDLRHPVLSKRQLEVLALMAKGMTNAEIAQELGLSLNTVKVYVSGILARLGLQSRAQVLHWALTRRKDDTDL